ncbi:hypothetical protein GCM10007901_23670 [Dyella acidisoli]|uniref:Uncharacterized protein n=1 Tax=Dyella acidisoli TaxID=1867834 RepID=A0ABQ5XNW5_9GAMM|nr:hypothetical protein GCM10007901_23670 [Dyella acidisoli]
MHAVYPLRHEHEAIKHDIATGKQALASLTTDMPAKQADGIKSTKDKATHRPFMRKPNRALPAYPAVADE